MLSPEKYTSKIKMNFHPEAKTEFDNSNRETIESANPIIELISSCFQINWFKEISVNVWLAVIKPLQVISNQFGLEKEYFVIGNGFKSDFHQRTLKHNPPENLIDRLDTAIRFVASDAPMANAFCSAWAQKNKATVIVLRQESESKKSPEEKIYQLLNTSLWRRDYFAEAEPVRDPSEFFGRENIVSELFTKIILGDPTAIFGLRKIGKSSLLCRLEDLIEQDKSNIGITAFLIGNSTRLKSGRWWDAANDMISTWRSKINILSKEAGLKIQVSTSNIQKLVGQKEANSRKLAIAFEKDVKTLLQAAKQIASKTDRDDVRLVLILDECDHFYPNLVDSGHWKTDFFEFWNTLQGIKRSLEAPEELVYFISGVNPSGVEQGSLLNQANPLYETQRIYLGPMSEIEASTLFLSLGKRMGLIFEESALNQVYKLVGGHPLLLRRLGSAIHESSKSRTDKKIIAAQDVDKAFKAKKRDLFNQVAWFLEHLAQVSPDEERMLRDIAHGEAHAYSDLWKDNSFRETYAHHLQQYGLLNFENDLPKITLNIIKEALKLPMASEFVEQKNQLKYIIDSIEQAVRIRLRVDLERNKAPEEAIEEIIKLVPSDARNRSMSREDLTDLGEIAGIGAVLDSLNWGDYQILLEKLHDDIEWSGISMTKNERMIIIKTTFKDAHLVRHNNDYQTKKLIDDHGFEEMYRKFSSIREILGG